MNDAIAHPLDHDILCIDTGDFRHRMVASYLVEQDGHVAFVDTGTARALGRLMSVLQSRGLSPEQVDYVIPTHVHLDHAGGSGSLMQLCPNAKLVIHPRGAPHMVDPSKLIAGSLIVYGEEVFARDFDTLHPVPQERVIVAEDGYELELGGRRLSFLDTPGHANHHFCVFDHRSRGFFTGDTFGISYREFDSDLGPFLFAPTTPVAFDPEAWISSVDRMLSYQPEWMYLTHFGAIVPTPEQVDQLKASIRRMAEIALAEEVGNPIGRQERIRLGVEAELVAGAMANGSGLDADGCRELLAFDADLNAQGLEVWLVRREKARRAGMANN